MRLIDADEIQNRLIEMCKPEYDKKRKFDVITTLAIAGFIKDPECVPTIDAVPVVRCKDCIHATMTSDGKYCKFCQLHTDGDGFMITEYLEADFYCSYGERRYKSENEG